MGLDGFAMSNLGLSTEMTSAQMANQAEHLAKKESEVKIKDIEESTKDQEVKRKKDEEQDNETPFNDGFTEEEGEEPQNKDDSDRQNQHKLALVEKDLETHDPKEFSVRINPQTDLVELFNNKEEKILETISANDLMELISKLDGASGILVNRKI